MVPRLRKKKLMGQTTKPNGCAIPATSLAPVFSIQRQAKLKSSEMARALQELGLLRADDGVHSRGG